MYAVVEAEPGVLEPVVVRGRRGSVLSVLRLDGRPAGVKTDDVVHVGIVGDENAPPLCFQWCPRWVAARLGADVHALAANPEKTLGFVYQSSDNKWTPKARRDRWKEQALYRGAMKPAERHWTALAANHVFGYERVCGMIEKYRRREVDPASFFWCMVFAALTASENTNTAEKNLAGFAAVLRRRLAAEGHAALSRSFTFEEFKREGAGLQEQRYETLLAILQVFPAIERFLRENRDLHDRALRDALVAQFPTPGLGITKLSFALETYGEDVACFDRWMLRAIGATEKVGDEYVLRGSKRSVGPVGTLEHVNRAIAAHKAHGVRGEAATSPVFAPVAPPPWPSFSDGAYVLQTWGAGRFGDRTEAAVREYEHFEDQLRQTEYFRVAVAERAPNPLCRAQWTMWEDILRRHPDDKVRKAISTHKELFFVIEGEGTARAEMEVALAVARARRAPAAPGLEAKAPPRLLENPVGGDAGYARWRAARQNVADAVSLLHRVEQATAATLSRRADDEEVRESQRVAHQQRDAAEAVVLEAQRLLGDLERSMFGGRTPGKAPLVKNLPRPAT